MAALVTSAPVAVPTGLRVVAGTIDGNGTAYSAGGLPITIAQFGGGVNGIPNRFPDFVIVQQFNAVPGDDADFANIARWDSVNHKLQVYGAAAAAGTDEEGLGELDDTLVAGFKATFLALWVTPDPAGQVAL